MNKSKKTIRGLQKEKKKLNININPKIWIIVSGILGLFLIAALLFDQLYKRPIVTIDGDKYYLEDLTYYFYNAESTVSQMYGQLYGDYAWDMPYDSSMSVRDFVKSETINNIVYNEVMYREAVANGYTLTEEEEKDIDEDINTLLNDAGLSKKFIKKNSFTSEYLKDVFTKIKLAERYKNDIIDSLGIDEEAIKAGIDYNEYKQYDVEYFFISTKKTNKEDNSTVEMSDEEKKAAYQKIADLREKALTADDWSSLLPEDEEELRYRDTDFLANGTLYPDEFKEPVMALENGEISDIFETEDGYYFVRMQNNEMTDAYEQAVEKAINEAEEEAFDKEYNENIITKHNYVLNERAIKNLRMGRITMVD